jgi:hypothetical protein
MDYIKAEVTCVLFSILFPAGVELDGEEVEDWYWLK